MLKVLGYVEVWFDMAHASEKKVLAFSVRACRSLCNRLALLVKGQSAGKGRSTVEGHWWLLRRYSNLMTSCERDSGMHNVRLGAGMDAWRISQYDDNASWAYRKLVAPK